MLNESVGELSDVMDGLGYVRSEVVTMGMIVIRTNQQAKIDAATF